MDDFYARTVRLLLRIAPDVFANDIFALKGGTAINLFIRDMPRLSVDIDVAYLSWQTPREQALTQIANEITLIAARLSAIGLSAWKIPTKEQGETKLLVESDGVQVKIEVNTVFRGTVLPITRCSLHEVTAGTFSADLVVPTLAADELYASKLVAAFDRQHPRDLFDIWQLLQVGPLSEATVECFVIYLAGHNRPIHEVLFSRDKNIALEYNHNFLGMTSKPVELSTLLEARRAMREELMCRLSNNHRRFLIGLARAPPDWSLLTVPHCSQLPALKWKVSNLEKFRKGRPADFELQANALQDQLI